MLIYRIEHKQKPTKGAFSGSDSPARHAQRQAGKEGAFDPCRHPCPDFDLGWGFNDDYFCGFPSLDAYRVWFVTPTVRAALWINPDYHMRVYDVPDHLVKIEMIQCCFRLEDATSVRVATAEEIA